MRGDEQPQATSETAPRTIEALWADFDPRRDELEVETLREWTRDGGSYRAVRFLVGTFKGRPARIAAIYGRPAKHDGKLPAVLHLHGGGQRAFQEEVRTYVERGYAALSINWGGREMEDAKPGEPNTDWGAVDPTQNNVPGYFSLLPGDKQLVPYDSPQNCNWYLLTIAARRGLTFLERQAEVDAERLGVYGHSMGGNLTMYVAGTDRRVKAAAPSVGGAGFRSEPHQLLVGVVQQDHIRGDATWFARTLGFESYAPLVRCPLLHLSGTNDFHGWMDDVYRTNRLVVDQPLRYSFAPHLNHRFSPETEATRPLWFDQFLRNGPALPETPRTSWQLRTDDGVPTFRVEPDRRTAMPVARVEVLYSVDPDPRARFWRAADAVRRDDGGWEARLPHPHVDRPLFAFANVYHDLPNAVSLPHAPNVGQVCISSLLHRAARDELVAAEVRATDKSESLLDDFEHGWRDWYRLNASHRPLWQHWTRKVTDPRWQGPDGAALEIRLVMPRANRLTFVVVENEWRSDRGRKRTFVCRREIPGDAAPQTVALTASDFRDPRGEALRDWRQLDLLGICARFDDREFPAETDAPNWNGDLPTFQRLAWRKSIQP